MTRVLDNIWFTTSLPRSVSAVVRVTIKDTIPQSAKDDALAIRNTQESLAAGIHKRFPFVTSVADRKSVV